METDDYASRYPIVSRMAKDLLAIQISKVASESAFSTSGRILDPYRSNLATPIVEALVCTQDWETSTIRKLRQSKISILCWMTSLLQGDVYPYGIHTGRCISIWHSHRINAAYDPYSLDSVFQDVQNQYCIQLYIRKELMFRFEALFEEGKCYLISNFSIHENHGNYPLLPHKFKIIFYKDTTVTRIEPFDDNTHGFKLEPFNRLLDSGNHVYSKQDSVDVIGCGRRIGKIVPVLSVVVQGVPRFRVVLRLIDGTGFAPAVFFNHQFVKLSGLTAWQLMEQCETDPEDYFPHELYTVLGKKWLFKIWFDEFNVRGNNHTYRCDAFSDEEILIAHFKRRLVTHRRLSWRLMSLYLILITP